MKIRVAQRGHGLGKVETLDDVTAGVLIPWIELVDEDGNTFRTSALTDVKFHATHDGLTRIDVALIAQIEIVYLGRDGEPTATPGGLIDYRTVVPREVWAEEEHATEQA